MGRADEATLDSGRLSGRAECLAGFSEVWVLNADANVQLVDP
jgi:hypothetical protein